MNAHELGKLLLQGDDLPVVIPLGYEPDEAIYVENTELLQNSNSPFEYCIMLTCGSVILKNDEIEIDDN